MKPHFYIYCHGDRTWLYDLKRGKFSRDKTPAQRLTHKQAHSFSGSKGNVYVIVPGGYGRTVTRHDLTLITVALGLLTDARDTLRKAGASKARAYVARCIKSTQGALNHARRMQRRQLPETPAL